MVFACFISLKTDEKQIPRFDRDDIGRALFSKLLALDLRTGAASDSETNDRPDGDTHTTKPGFTTHDPGLRVMRSRFSMAASQSSTPVCPARQRTTISSRGKSSRR